MKIQHMDVAREIWIRAELSENFDSFDLMIKLLFSAFSIDLTPLLL